MTKSTIVRARIEPGLKTEVEAILLHLGLTTSDAIQLLCRQIKLQKGLPFDVRIPNRLTAKTLRESKTGKGVKRLGSKQELYSELGL